jgi:hypothetical protein
MPDLAAIFDTLKPILARYQPPFTSKRDEAGYYDLWSLKDLVIEGRKRKEIFFAGLITQSSYVGFYFMPVYIDREIKAVFAPELLRLLKGKSCFYIRRTDAPLLEHIAQALEAGYQLYCSRGWV